MRKNGIGLIIYDVFKFRMIKNRKVFIANDAIDWCVKKNVQGR